VAHCALSEGRAGLGDVVGAIQHHSQVRRSYSSVEMSSGGKDWFMGTHIKEGEGRCGSMLLLLRRLHAICAGAWPLRALTSSSPCLHICLLNSALLTLAAVRARVNLLQRACAPFARHAASSCLPGRLLLSVSSSYLCLSSSTFS